jgi:putative ABC transport system permease protein
MGGGERKWFASVRLNTADLDQVLASIRTLWQEIEPTHPMRFEFLDEEFTALYEEQSRFGNTVLYSGLLTLLIALLGLFGLTMFSVQRRVKEIGIRKILGASVSSIVKLISLEFILLIIVAFVIAVPVSFYIVRKWLENFAYQTDVSWWLFPVIGLVIIIIAMITASVQSVRAANLRPATTLRSE